VLASLLLPRTGHGFCRTTTVPIPASYSPEGGCFTEGLPLFWRGACVGYAVNENASVKVPLADATRVIDAAFAAWNVACEASQGPVGIATESLGVVSCSEVRYNQNAPNQNVIVFRDDVWPHNDTNSTLALTTVTFNSETGEIYDADMEINATGPLSTTAVVPPDGFDLASIVTHEAGHFLGLAHATDMKSTMFARYVPGSSSLRTLSKDDIAGLCEIYPDATKRNVAPSADALGLSAATTCDATPRHDFATTCDGQEPAGAASSSCTAAPAGIGPSHDAWAIAAAAAGLVALLRRRTRATHPGCTTGRYCGPG
jgi:hypothetical protein